MKKILITGGVGYIGSITNQLLKDKGYQTVIFDKLDTDKTPSAQGTKVIKGNLLDLEQIQQALKTEKPDAVIHFAAFIEMGESYVNPAKYYRNNVLGSLNLLEAMTKTNVSKLVFSSSAGVYGSPKEIPIKEDAPKNPQNPYGQTKWDMENMMSWFDKAHNLKFIALRYFNACGATLDASLGETHQPESHIIPIFLDKAFNQQPLQINGQDYLTPDKTCVRDYVHVLDLASAHQLALESLFKDSPSTAYNLGTGQGYSNLQIANKVIEITKQKVEIIYGPRRPGDADSLVADPTRIKQELGWVPQHSDLDTIISTASNWYKKSHKILS